MPEINANIVVETVGLTIDQQDPGINIQPEVINMTLYTAGYANPGGNVGTLQYNAGGYFDGVPYANYSNSNLTLGNVNQVKLLGGSNAYFLQTDGTGNLTWASGTVSSNGNGTSNGANTQIQMSDGTGNFVGAAGFTFDYIANSLAVPGEGIFTGNILSGNANLGNAASANFFLGNGSLLTGIDTNIISNGSSNVKIPTLNGNVTISVDGVTNVVVVANNAVNMAANLNVTGNITAGNISGTQLISNIATGTAPLVVTSTTQVANLNAATAGTANSATTAGTVTTAAQPNITSVGTLTNLAVTGNTTSGNFIGVFANGNSNINIPASNGNVNISSAGNANIAVVTGTGVNVAGTLNVTGNTLLQSLRTKDQEIAIGNNAQGVGPTGVYAIAIGLSAGETNQGQQAIAIGESAGDFDQSANSIAIGTYAGLTSQGANSIAIGAGAGNFQQHSNSIILNATGANFTSDGANRFFVKPVRNANTSNLLFYNQSTGEISYDAAPSGTIIQNGTSNVSIPAANGNINISSAGNANILIVTGTGVNIAGNLSVTGMINGNVNGNVNGNANYANFAGNVINASQPNITSVGNLTSLYVSGTANIGNINLRSSIIGLGSGVVTGANIPIAIGNGATSNGNATIAIGSQAQATGQESIAIGRAAGIGGGSNSTNKISIGSGAGQGNSGVQAIAIGLDAGANNMSNLAIAIGSRAGDTNQGISSIAIGAFAGRTNQANNTIILNATQSNLNQTTANTFTVKPIRNARNDQTLVYDTTTGEISYTNYIKTISTTVGALVAAATVGAGTRAFVTDANTTTFLATVGGSGANSVPVVSDGTNWLVG